MTSSPPVKVLTVGAAVGSIRELFNKVKAIDSKHGKFDIVLFTGDFFGPPKEGADYGNEDEVVQLLNGSLEAPLECFIMQGDHPLPPPVIEKFAITGGALCKNVFLLQKSGLFTTTQGLRIACLGGIFDENLYHAAESPHGFTSPYFTNHTIEKLLSNTMTQTTSSGGRSTSYTSMASIMAATNPSHMVDVLLTNSFPNNITALSSAPRPSPSFPSEGAEPVSELVRRTKPRYHFVAGKGGQKIPMFWEREPFAWESEGGRITRFVSLGAFGGEQDSSTGKKQRWFYAFSITPQSPNTPGPSRPANATSNPLADTGLHRGMKRPFDSGEGEAENFRWGNVKQGDKRTRTANQEGRPPTGYKCKICESSEHFINDCPDRAKPKEGYICKICNEPGHFVRDCPTKHQVGDTGGRKPKEGYVCRACGSEAHYIQDCPVATQPQHGRRQKGPPKEIAPDECWFCLSNPRLAKHLIVSIGNECYVTLPKGQIIPTHSKSDSHSDKISAVPGGGHVLIVPITHYPTYASIPPDLSEPILQETRMYKSALGSFYSAYNAHPVSFEVGRLSAKGGHAHVQVVPIPRSISSDVIADTFISEGSRIGIDIDFETPSAALQTGDRGYFKVDLPDGRRLVHWMKDGVPFSIQFGRQVLVSLLGIPERFDWKECTQDEDEDRTDAQSFKVAFARFDPSL